MGIIELWVITVYKEHEKNRLVAKFKITSQILHERPEFLRPIM